MEKLLLKGMVNKFGYSHKPEFVKPESQRIYRCGFPGCRETLNPNGIERNIRAHCRKAHSKVTGVIFVTVERHDGKSQFFQIGGNQGDLLEGIQKEKNDAQASEQGVQKQDSRRCGVKSVDNTAMQDQLEENKDDAPVSGKENTKPGDTDRANKCRQEKEVYRAEAEPEGEIELDDEEEEKMTLQTTAQPSEPGTG